MLWRLHILNDDFDSNITLSFSYSTMDLVTSYITLFLDRKHLVGIYSAIISGFCKYWSCKYDVHYEAVKFYTKLQISWIVPDTEIRTHAKFEADRTRFSLKFKILLMLLWGRLMYILQMYNFYIQFCSFINSFPSWVWQ